MIDYSTYTMRDLRFAEESARNQISLARHRMREHWQPVEAHEIAARDIADGQARLASVLAEIGRRS